MLGDFKNAFTFGKLGLSNHPNSAMILSSNGHAYLRNKQYEIAKTYFENALKIVPENYDILHQLGIIYYYLKDLKKSEDALRKALSINSNDQPSIYLLSKFIVNKRPINELGKLVEDSFITHSLAGEIAYMEKDYERASFHYQNALKKDPKSKRMLVWFLESKLRENRFFRWSLNFHPKIKGILSRSISLFLAVYTISLFLLNVKMIEDSFILFWTFFAIINIPILTFWIFRPIQKWRISSQFFSFKA
jgi:tetratricopeptide (TPR) repeat protein